MDQTLKTPPGLVPTAADAETNATVDQNTPPPPNQDNIHKPQTPPICNTGKNGTPDRLKLPKAFKYPERYTSPTDQMMSPATRGILARSRKGSKLFPPSANHPPKIPALQLQELSPLQMDKCLN
ncbi:hypothetical protein Salat_2172000 [Sesamum alatum]|uniref:Uncharacterized protein n=1 Tax=Sesamum alatum TaxID=300844 RepID=A0AAE1XT39_9LAMI|nr:hypothetical protein Salat_2172000 [Sesamum alatum]